MVTAAPRAGRAAVVVPCLLAAVLLAVLGSPAMRAASERVILARPEVGTLHGMRAISRLDGPVYRDESAHGMRVGTGPGGETRIVVFKPAFTEPVDALRDWRTVEVGWQVGGTSCVLSQPLHYWGADTPSSMVHSLPTTDVTTAYLHAMFDRMLVGGGNYSLTTGCMLRSTATLDGPPVDLTFFVTIRNANPFVVDAQRLVQFGDGTFRLTWRSSRRGYADIWVNGLRRVADQFTAAERVNQNTIYTDWLVSGVNEVQVTVREPENAASTAASAVLTASYSG